MRLSSGALTLAAGVLFARARGARVCGNGTSASPSYQYQLIDVRYDGPDPSKTLGVSTIAIALGSTSGTTLYECISQWPEAWAGWYQGGTNLIWGDCIWTGAGAGQDKTVAFAVDWKSKSLHVANTFDCSDKKGSEASATGVLTIDFECSTLDGASYCIPKSTTGSRPSLRITTSVGPTVDASTCTSSFPGRSWRVEDWKRQYEMAPGSSAPGSPLTSDTGPSFTLRSLASNNTFSCATAVQQNGTAEGSCKPLSASNGAASFRFDSRLNILKISESAECSGSPRIFNGVGYFQAACDRGFRSIVFSCTSEPLWIGA